MGPQPSKRDPASQSPARQELPVLARLLPGKSQTHLAQNPEILPFFAQGPVGPALAHTCLRNCVHAGHPAFRMGIGARQETRDKPDDID
ncbi:hypothetical protein NBRC116588_05780 [Pyruvatibacter sp. HU-CL02332]